MSKQNHRRPTLPFQDASKGTCVMCGKSVGKTKTGRPSKARWHKTCLTEYRRITRPSNTRRAVYKRDVGVCAKCGHESAFKGGDVPWQADHITPLKESGGDIKYWQLGNLQTLCSDCHKEKTSAEATARAISRKLFKD